MRTYTQKSIRKQFHLLFFAYLWVFCFTILLGCNNSQTEKRYTSVKKTKEKSTLTKKPETIAIDTVDYNKRIQELNNGDTNRRWQIKTPYPLPGALLPYKRIVAFYGNLYSKRMGILGELPKEQMLKKLQKEVASWQKADTSTVAIPALHYIAVTAQSKPGKNNKYRLRMAHHQIDTILSWAKSINAIVFLDIQIGQSSVEEEVKTLEKYLKLPNVHLAIDPEFAMQNGMIPGSKIGTLSAAEINKAIDILTTIVKENNLPPKLLVIHRFTQGMVTDYQKIKTGAEVQIIINMDGFGNKALKRHSYNLAIYREPVQFTGFKLFYKNDTKGNGSLYTPKELLRFKPIPIYIQYQ